MLPAFLKFWCCSLSHNDKKLNSFLSIRLTRMPTGIQPGLNLYLLNDNQISLVPGPEAYSFCTQCNKVWIHNNPLVCNTKMFKMLAWFIAHNVTVSTLFYNHKMTPYCVRIPMEGNVTKATSYDF